MEVVNQASVITLDSDTDDEVSSSMLRRIPQRSSPHVVFRGAENGKDVEDDEQISRLRRLKRMIDRTDTVETKALPNTNNPFSSVDSGSGFHFQQTSPRRMVDNTLRSYVGVRARSRSLPFPEYDRLANNVPPVAGPPEFLPWRRALNRHKTPPVEGYYDLARRYTTQFDDEYEDLEDDLGQPSYPVTRWPSPLEADLDINLRDQPVDLADELTPQSFDKVLATILEVLPDVCPDYVREKYQERLPWGNADSLLNDILADDKYPKRKSKTKRAREADEDATALTEFVPNDQLSIA